MATDKFVTYPETVLFMGVETTLATLVLWIVDSEERFISTPKGWRIGERLVALFPVEDRETIEIKHPDSERTAEVQRISDAANRTGEVVKVHPDDWTFFKAAIQKPSCGFPKLVGANPESGAPMKLDLGRRCLPLVDAWENADDEHPEEVAAKQLAEQN